MRAWRVHEPGEPRDVLRLDDVDELVPGRGEVLVRVDGAPVSFPDVLLCRGAYQVRPPLPFTPGIEVCGEVVAVGEGVVDRAVGDRVIGSPLLPAGGLAEQALLAAAEALPAPAVLDDAEAAALHIAYQTGWFALHRRAALQPGETLLVHAAAGGVGSAAVQLGKAAGARVVGVVGGQGKVEAARAMGADVVVDRSAEDFVEVVKDVTDGRGADVVYDPVGGEAYRRSTKCIAFEGRILLIGFASGEIEAARLNHALIKSYSIVGVHWGLYRQHDPAAVRRCHDELLRLAETGAIRPLVGERVPLEAAAGSLQAVAEGRTVGRVVVVR